jgi:DnaJ-class molecular chaperone
MIILVLIGIVLVAGYLVSLRLHPLAKCQVCDGTGREFGLVYTYSQRRCRRCLGTGRYDRWGTRLLYGGTGDSGRFRR